jgi:hypothetical protein
LSNSLFYIKTITKFTHPFHFWSESFIYIFNNKELDKEASSLLYFIRYLFKTYWTSWKEIPLGYIWVIFM